jgi:hypothetical protein
VGDTDRCYAGLGLGDGAAGGVAAATTARAEEYEEVLGRLSSLISQKVRAHTGNRGNQWELLERYIQVRCPLLTLLRPSPLLNPVGMYCLIRADLAVTVRADSGAGGAHRADEGDPCRGDQREGKSLAIQIRNPESVRCCVVPSILRCTNFINQVVGQAWCSTET